MKSVLLAISFGAAHTMNWGAGAPAPDKPRLRGAERPAAPAPAGPTTPPAPPPAAADSTSRGPASPFWDFKLPDIGAASPPSTEATGVTPARSDSSAGTPAPSPPNAPAEVKTPTRSAEPKKVAARVTQDVPGQRHSVRDESGRDSGQAPTLWRVWSASDGHWWTGTNLDDLRRWVADRNSSPAQQQPVSTYAAPQPTPTYTWPGFGGWFGSGGCSGGRCGR